MNKEEKVKYKDSFIILNEKGLHTRPSTELVKCASSFKSQVTLFYQDLVVNAKSLLGILMLAAARGAKIRIEAEGEDAEQAVKTILSLARNKFNIKY
ncbi:MAG TPA: HPr family phosphocarrier protein [Rhabdochlamydiaceae bacterium]|nr:HPr family phosphocarrier protein [Rhabdochlamydiaceae bacterium]